MELFENSFEKQCFCNNNFISCQILIKFDYKVQSSRLYNPLLFKLKYKITLIINRLKLNCKFSLFNHLKTLGKKQWLSFTRKSLRHKKTAKRYNMSSFQVNNAIIVYLRKLPTNICCIEKHLKYPLNYCILPLLMRNVSKKNRQQLILAMLLYSNTAFSFYFEASIKLRHSKRSCSFKKITQALMSQQKQRLYFTKKKKFYMFVI